jgi:hypothetical protein
MSYLELWWWVMRLVGPLFPCCPELCVPCPGVIPKDREGTRRRVQYKVYDDMWDYIGGARRHPGP